MTGKSAGLADAFAKTHERIVGRHRPAPPGGTSPELATPRPQPAGPSAAPAKPAAPKPAGRYRYVNTRLPADVHKTLRKICIDKDVSLQELVTKALTEYARSKES